MNVFHRYTRRSLRLSPARTLVTIIGIVLSMSLFTAVIEGAYSGLQYLIRGEIEVSGAYHGFYYDLDSNTKDQVLADSAIDDAAVWQRVGWADTGGRYQYSYLLIEDAGDNIADLLSVRLTQGSRMPENEHELLLPLGLSEMYLPEGAERYQAGDTLTLHVGHLLGDGQDVDEMSYFSLSDYNELELVDAAPHTYTVVGYYIDFSGSVSLDKRVALTKGGGTGSWRVFFTLKDPESFYTWLGNAPYGRNYDSHGGLLRYYGTFRTVGITEMLYGFAGVLIFLISFGSISLIYNSFSISVSERTRQFGLLKSVGATKKQIRSTVLYEALLLSAVGIPIGLVVGCTGIGITLWALRDFFNALFAAGDGLTTRIGLAPAPGPLALSAAICLATVLISAWIPARRAIRLTAIDAIRQSGDVKVDPHEVQVSPATSRLFGFEGMMAAKSFKRGRKRYRSTIFSLFLSVTLFISASSLCAYITDTVEAMASGESKEDLRYVRQMDEGEDPNAALAELTVVEGVTDGLYYDWTSLGMWVDRSLISGEFRRIQGDPSTAMMYEENGWINMYMRRVFLDDASFRKLCADNGIDPADFFDPQAPAALFYNRYTTQVSRDEGSHWISWEIYDRSAFPTVVQEQSYVEIDGYIMAYIDHTESGEEIRLYYPWDYYEEFFEVNPNGGILDMDRSRAIILSREEAARTYDHRVLAAVDEVPFAFEARTPALFYPYSMMEAATGAGTSNRGGWMNFAFLTSDHRLAYENMSRLLKERDDAGNLYDAAEYGQRTRMVVVIVSVFAYGFITLISLIAAANVFNTISTNVSLRRRELAMLNSIGLSEKGLRKMMSYECVIYGLRGLLWGLPVSVVMTYVIYRVASGVLTISFYIPWYIQRFYNSAKAKGRVKRYEGMKDLSLSAKTIRGLHAMLRQCLDQAVQERLIPYNPAAGCKLPAKEKKEMRTLPAEKISAYLVAAEEHGVLPMFYLELTTGLRRGELVALRWDDLDVENQTLTVNKSAGRINGEVKVTQPKTANSVRTICLPKETINLLIQEHAKHPNNPVMFPSPVTGRLYGPDCLGRLHKTLLKKAGITENIPFHGLRHTFATLAIQQGVDAKTVSSILGHYSAGFTLDTYTHVTGEMQKDAAQRMGSFMAQ